MHQTDLEAIAFVEAQDRSMGELFLIQERVYWSTDAGDFCSSSTYKPYMAAPGESEEALISLLKRLAAPAYESTSQLDDEISLLKEWEELFAALTQILEQHGKHEPSGDSDYYLVDDVHALPQHKVECTSNEALTPELVVDVQSVLKKYSREWEVIFALPAIDGKDRAFSVFASSCVEPMARPTCLTVSGN
jgi:hypothetical protein